MTGNEADSKKPEHCKYVSQAGGQAAAGFIGGSRLPGATGHRHRTITFEPSEAGAEAASSESRVLMAWHYGMARVQ